MSTPVALIQPADFACVPVAGAVGLGISVGEWANGGGFARYDHAFVYLGYFVAVPVTEHPVTVVNPGAPGHWVAEAHPGGAQLRRLHSSPAQVPGAQWSSGAYDLTGDQRRAIVAAAFGYLGTPYSAADYLALATHKLHLWPADTMLKGYIASGSHMICSQYVDRCYNDAGVHLFQDGRWDGYVTPLDLEVAVAARLAQHV